MRTIIIDDERLSAQRLEKLIGQVAPLVKVEAVLASVKSSLDWLNSNPPPDFLMLDIQLGDGLGFDILEQSGVKCPVIFTTAFNEYAVKAFRLNSIDYLLKPIVPEELAEAIRRVEEKSTGSLPSPNTAELAMTLQMITRRYKERFMIRSGEKIHLLPVSQIAAFVSLEGDTFASSAEGRLYDLDLTLDQLTRLLDPAKFFRISRKYIIAVDAIESVVVFSGSRLKLRVKGVKTDEVFVSRERVGEFRVWMDR